MSDALVHLGEDGQPCKQHPPATLASVLGLASVGARVPGFNHDIASKLQGMMMALDELDELIDQKGDPDLRRALDTAATSMKELNGLLTGNRALTRGAKPTRTTLRELVRQSAERSGVLVNGEVVDAPLECAVPLLAHAISLVIDVATGVQRSRSVDVVSKLDDGTAEVAFSCVATQTPTASELLALAAHGIARERGELRCGGARIKLRFPIA